MKIKLELDDKEAEVFLVARTKDINVTKYSDEAKQAAVRVALLDALYETIGAFEVQRATELKKLQMQQWIADKQRVYNGASAPVEKEGGNDTDIHDKD